MSTPTEHTEASTISAGKQAGQGGDVDQAGGALRDSDSASASSKSMATQMSAPDTLGLNRVAYLTIVRKEIRRFLRIWVQTITPPAINALLYLVIFGGLIGSRISEMGGVSYLNFIMPGIIMMGIISNSYANVSSSFFSAKFQHSIEEMLVSPVSNFTILLGFVTGGVCRGLLVGLLVGIVALGFTGTLPHNFLITFMVAILTAVLFSLGGLINAVFAKSFDEISIIPHFVLTPLTYLGGIFYSIQMLPDFWQGMSKINPILYMINGFRFGILGISDIPIAHTFAVLLAFILFFFLLALRLIDKGIGIKN